MFATLVSMMLALTSLPSSASVPAQSSSPTFVFPVACKIGGSCLIQKFVDHDPGPGRRDYRCGSLTTDGHDGTDIRVRTMADMRSGYDVVAARAGTVLRIRDGEPDVSVGEGPAPDMKRAGNAVVIDHGDGWQTQYSHLRRDSVRVRPGQQVAAGEPIGLIGLSGNSEFPHLHFTIRHNDVAVDPFTADGSAPCGDAPAAPTLWTGQTAAMLGYRAAAVVTAGLASEVPPRSVADRDPAAGLTGTQAPLILWVDAIGAKQGDEQEFSIIGPSGRIVHSQISDVASGGLSWFTYSGKRAPPTGWQPGRYTGRYALRRNRITVAEAEIHGIIK
jgi:murein DD-endopeptidase MepM/ murein hydrolase activator NlpD